MGRRPPDYRPDAPVALREERLVAAPAERVWERLTGFDRWAAWHPGIAFAVLRGELAPGSALHWRADGMRIASRIVEVERGRRAGWTLRTLGARGYQRWILEPLGEGRTRVTLEESWEGPVVHVLGRTLRRTLVRSRSVWLDRLRSRSEAPEGNAVGETAEANRNEGGGHDG